MSTQKPTAHIAHQHGTTTKHTETNSTLPSWVNDAPPAGLPSAIDYFTQIFSTTHAAATLDKYKKQKTEKKYRSHPDSHPDRRTHHITLQKCDFNRTLFTSKFAFQFWQQIDALLQRNWNPLLSQLI
jgi:hypothetical protein